MRWVAWVVVAGLLAGCVGAPAAEDASSADEGTGTTGGATGGGSGGHSHGAMAGPLTATPPPFELRGAACREGGGHSVHPASFNPLPAPWKPADVIDDVGPQYAYSEIPDPGDPTRPVPEKGHTIGNYHATILCDGWTFNGEDRQDILFGFVGMKVKQPDFSDAAPTHHYLVTVVATSDEAAHHALVEGGIAAMKATGSWEEMQGGMLRIQMQTDHNGEYDSIFLPKAVGPMKAAHVRLWFQHDNGDGTYTPVALDLVNAGGEHFTAEQQGYFSHTGTHHHDPLPGAAGKTAALMYAGFDRVVTWGPRPMDVRIDGAYDH